MSTYYKIFTFLLVCQGATAAAAGIDGGSLRSTFGSPLDFHVAVWGDDGGEDIGRCIVARVLDGASEVSARDISIELENGSGRERRALTIRTRRRLVEPVTTVTVEVGCDAKFSRRFVGLSDPAVRSPGERPVGEKRAVEATPYAARFPQSAASAVVLDVPARELSSVGAISSHRAFAEASKPGSHRHHHRHRLNSTEVVAKVKVSPSLPAKSSVSASPAKVSYARLLLDTSYPVDEGARALPASTISSVPNRPALASAPRKQSVDPVDRDRLQWLEFQYGELERQMPAQRALIEQLRGQLRAQAADKASAGSRAETHSLGRPLAWFAVVLLAAAAVIRLIRHLLSRRVADVDVASGVVGAFMPLPSLPQLSARQRLSAFVRPTGPAATAFAGAIVKRTPGAANGF